ncbi:PHO85 cyclin-5 [Blastocladiella emersonii ATCC 22665]|nr:PHO85 cyclin-5 [Blastocladiella emersonii ATCC 22665]
MPNRIHHLLHHSAARAVVVDQQPLAHAHVASTAAAAVAAAPLAVAEQTLQRHDFVRALVVTAADVIDTVLPAPPTAAIPLAGFIAELLRRSRASFSTLQLALFYLFRFRAMSSGSPSPLASCSRRLFLASLVTAAKYLQDSVFSNRGWARVASLPAAEVTRLERMFLAGIAFELYVPPAVFASWSATLVAHVHNAVRARAAEMQVEHEAILAFDFAPRNARAAEVYHEGGPLAFAEAAVPVPVPVAAPTSATVAATLKRRTMPTPPSCLLDIESPQLPSMSPPPAKRPRIACSEIVARRMRSICTLGSGSGGGKCATSSKPIRAGGAKRASSSSSKKAAAFQFTALLERLARTHLAVGQ